MEPREMQQSSESRSGRESEIRTLERLDCFDPMRGPLTPPVGTGDKSLCEYRTLLPHRAGFSLSWGALLWARPSGLKLAPPIVHQLSNEFVGRH